MTYFGIQSVDTLTTIILLLILTCIILSASVAILWYRYNELKDIITIHLASMRNDIKEIEDMIS